MCIKKNLSIQLLSKLVEIASPLLLIPIVIREFGQEAFGLYSVATAAYAILTLITEWNSSTNGLADISAHRNKVEEISGTVSLYLTTRIIVGSVLFIMVSLVIFSSDLSGDNKTFMYLYILSIVPFSLSCSWFFFGLEDFKTPLMINVSTKLFYLVVLLLFINFNVGSSLVVVAFLFFVSHVISAIVYMFKIYQFGVKINRKVCFDKIKSGLNIVSANAVLAYFAQGNTIFVAKVFSIEMAGEFNLNYKLPAVISSLAQPLNQIFFPRLAFLYAHNKDEYMKTKRQVVFLFVVFGGGLSIVSFFASEHLFVYLEPGLYNPVMSIIFSLCIPLFLVGGLNGNLLIIRKKSTVWRNLQFISFLINIVFSLAAYYFKSIVVLCIGMLVCQILIVFVSSWLCHSSSNSRAREKLYEILS